MLHRCLVVACSLLAGTFVLGVVPERAAAGGDPPPIELSALADAAVPTSFVLVVDIAGATSATLVIDGAFAAKDRTAPLSFPVTLTAGDHRVRVRATVDGDETRTDVSVTASPSATAPTPTPSRPRAPARPGGRSVDGVWQVDTVDELSAALADARPGDEVNVADGVYLADQRLVASASGTAEAPIRLRGSRRAVVRTEDPNDDYGLHVTGDQWRIEGITVAYASKGIVLDGSVGTVIDDVEVHDIGAEGVHFRTCSSDGVLRNSYVHDTGVDKPQFGEGVYVGSAGSNWSKYECVDSIERQDQGADNTERVLVEDNVFEDVTAEGADLKEGTDSGIVRGNVFRRVGTSGENSADSAVDVKGNGWVVEDNVVTQAMAAWNDDGTMRPSRFADGFQTHEVADGYGTGNVVRHNVVIGDIPGWGVGLYPASDNVVGCDNRAAGAALGLVGSHGRPIACTR